MKESNKARTKRLRSQPLTAAAAAAAGVLLAASSAGFVGAESVPRGVSPKDAELYQPKSGDRWKCLHSGEEIPFRAINDDYCDCKDGSDEPGTSACHNSRFYCANEGHIPAYILSSRVNDGICDPECCDGSDEYDGKVSCPNLCAKIGKEYRLKMAHLENTRRAGAKIRAKYISDAKKKMESLTSEIATLTVALGEAKTKEAKTKAALDYAESADKETVEKKMATPLYHTIKSHQTAMDVLYKRNHELKQELEELTNLLDDLAKSYNPNYQDMAVKGAVMAYRTWKRDGSEDGSEDDSGDGSKIASEPPLKLNRLKDEGEWSREKVEELVRKDALELLDAIEVTGKSHESGLLFRIHEYLPDSVVPYFEAFVDTLLDLLLKANIITSFKRSRPVAGDAEIPENVVHAREAHNIAANEVNRIESDLRNKKTAVELAPEKWGRDGEFKALEGTCVEKPVGEFVYEFCFGGRATQKPKSGMNVSLGSFGKFDPDNTSAPTEDAFYLKMLLDNGQRCWNGPDRSVLVDLVCDTKNELLDVFEAEKCIYSMKVSTPAVCFPPAVDPAAGMPAVHAEL